MKINYNFIAFTCICLAIAFIIQNAYATLLKVVDQGGAEIAGSKIGVPGVGIYTTGTSTNIPAGRYDVSIAPGLNGKPGDFNYLARKDTVTVTNSMPVLKFEWRRSPVTVTVTDQGGAPACSIIPGVIKDYLLNTYTLTLPITDKSIYPTIYGSCANGYTLKSPEFIKQSEVFKVSGQPLTLKRTWNNPYYQASGLTAERFAKIIENLDVDKPLKKQDGQTVAPYEVSNLYGKSDGFTIYDGGVDVCSREYAKSRGFDKPLSPVYQDLSAGWPKPEVKSGQLAIDPVLGRFALFSGNYPQKSLIISKGFAYTGFGVPGISDIKVRGSYAYLAPGEGNFQIVDISNKKHPKLAGHFFADFRYNPEVYKDVCFLTRSSIYTVDISHPDNPQWLNGSAPWTPSKGSACRIVARNGYGFVAVAFSNIGFYVLDISDPVHLKVAASLDLGEPLGAGELFVEGDRAYIGIPGRSAGFSKPKGGGVVAIDIHNPLKPKVLGSYKGEPGEDKYYTPYLLGHKGSLMIMASDWRPGDAPPARPARLLFVDMSNPRKPVRRGVYSFVDKNNGNLHDVKLKGCAVKGNYVYVTDCNYDYYQDSLTKNNPATHLFTLDISRPDRPRLVNTVSQKPARYMYVSCYDNYLYVNDYNYGMRIFDVSDPQKPESTGGMVTAGEGRWAWTNEDGTRSYISQTFGSSIFCVDVTNTSNPAVIGAQYWDGEWIDAPFKGKGNTLYIPKTYGISVVDFNNPSNPVKVREAPECGSSPKIEIEGDYLYAVFKNQSNLNKFVIYDISYSKNPVVVSQTTIGTGGCAPKLCVNGRQAYIMCGSADKNKLLVVDISNALKPAVVGQLSDSRIKINYTSVFGGDLAVSNGGLYILSGPAGGTSLFYIVDVTNPRKPVFKEVFNDKRGVSEPESILAYKDFLILDDYYYLLVYDIKDRTNPKYVDIAQTGGIASWNLGNIQGTNLYCPTLDGLKTANLPAFSEGLKDKVSARGRLAYE